MKTFYLIRHGEQQKTIGDPGLSELGQVQAQKTATYLQQFPITKLVSSPIRRTQETAQFISERLNLPYEINPHITERANWGDDPNQSFEDFDTMWRQSSQQREWQPPVGDSSINSGKRLEKAITELLTIDDEHIALVAHGGLIGDFVRNIFSYEELNEHILEFHSMPEGKVKHCSITIIEFDDVRAKPKVTKLAAIEHLAF